MPTNVNVLFHSPNATKWLQQFLFKWTCVLPHDEMHMTLSSDFEKNVPFVNKFAVKVSIYLTLGLLQSQVPGWNFSRTPHLHYWDGLFSGCIADELVYLSDAMQMNWMQCRWIAHTFYQNNNTEYSELTGHQNMKFKTSSCKKVRPEDVMI